MKLEAAFRLLESSSLVESMPIKQGVNFSKMQFVQDLKALKEDFKHSNVSFLGKKGDLTLYWLKNKRLPAFYFKNEQDEVVGFLDVIGSSNTVRAVYIDAKYRGQGLGTVLYLAAIKYLKVLRSSTNIGIMAVRSWKSVSKYFKVNLLEIDDRGNSNQVEYEWGPDNIPIVNGKPITKQPDNFIFVARRS